MPYYERDGQWLKVPEPVPLQLVVRNALLNALAHTDGDQKRAAACLGVTARQLNYALVTYGIPTDRGAAIQVQKSAGSERRRRLANLPPDQRPALFSMPKRNVARRSMAKQPAAQVAHGPVSTRLRYHVRWVGLIEATSPREAARVARGAAFYEQPTFDVRAVHGKSESWEAVNLDDAPLRLVGG